MTDHQKRSSLFMTPWVLQDPGAGGTITISRYGTLCEVTTATAESRTLAAPLRSGMLCTVILTEDGGDLTLTVNPTSGTAYGYNGDNATTIVYSDAGDFVQFYSIEIGSECVWRVLGHEGTNVAVEALEVDTLTASTLAKPAVLAAEHGAGAIGTAFAPRTYRYTRDGTIITEIEIDLTGLDSSGTENDVIGLGTGGAAYLGRNVVATNGIIYKVEMTCLEVPTGGDADIILVQGSAADEAFDDTVANTAAICDGTGDWGLGETIVNIAPALTANYYYYLTQGATDDATYTAGMYLIRFYGHAVLA